MWLPSIFPILSVAGYALTLVSCRSYNTTIVTRVCATEDPSDDIREAHRVLQGKPPNHLKVLRPQNTTVETYLHFVTTFQEATSYSPSVRTKFAKDQINVLNAAYASVNIQFVLRDASYTINDAWATDTDSVAMKSTLRRGTYTALNIYLQTNLSAHLDSYGSTRILGYCNLPSNNSNTPSDYSQDGCNVIAGSLPYGTMLGYNQGKTAVHETGHWFGLLHTFQDNSCAIGDPGDYIDDTPQESAATYGCPESKDSCPQSPGEDPIENYMDYSDDSCYTGFTSDQGNRMNNMFDMFRRGK